jgi:hypothetical protein
MPALKEMVDGEIDSFAVSLLVSVTTVPPAGAGADKVTGNGADSPSPTLAVPGRVMLPSTATETLAVASVRYGSELARIVVLPAATPLTGTVSVLVPAGNGSEAGTDAIPELSEVRFMVKLGGAGAERFSVRVPLPPAPMVRVLEAKLSAAVTRTV